MSIMSIQKAMQGKPVARARFPQLAPPMSFSPGPFGFVRGPNLTPVMGVRGQLGSFAPTARSTVLRGVAGGSFLGAIGAGLGSLLGGGNIGSAIGAFGNALTGPPASSKPGVGVTGPAIGTGSGIGTSGTAGGGCVTVLGQQFCLGGSAGAGSNFSAIGGTAAALPTGAVTATPSAPPAPVVAGSATHVAAMTGSVPRGYHLNRKGYYTHAGYVAPGSKAVRNRRRNPLNPRALSHALVRMSGFERAAVRIEKNLARVARRHAPKRRSYGRAQLLVNERGQRLLPAKCGCE